jgi:hypothetical protein
MVGRAVLCPPCGIHMIWRARSDAPYRDGPQGGGYSAAKDLVALKGYPQKRGDELNPRWQRSRESCSFDRRQPPDRAALRAVAA